MESGAATFWETSNKEVRKAGNIFGVCKFLFGILKNFLRFTKFSFQIFCRIYSLVSGLCDSQHGFLIEV